MRARSTRAPASSAARTSGFKVVQSFKMVWYMYLDDEGYAALGGDKQRVVNERLRVL